MTWRERDVRRGHPGYRRPYAVDRLRDFRSKEGVPHRPVRAQRAPEDCRRCAEGLKLKAARRPTRTRARQRAPGSDDPGRPVPMARWGRGTRSPIAARDGRGDGKRLLQIGGERRARLQARIRLRDAEPGPDRHDARPDRQRVVLLVVGRRPGAHLGRDLVQSGIRSTVVALISWRVGGRSSAQRPGNRRSTKSSSAASLSSSDTSRAVPSAMTAR